MTPETVLMLRREEDKIWRLRELSEVVRACAESNDVRRSALTRASVPVFYAHWEGFFTLATNAYLNFVADKRVPLSSLKENFWVQTVRKKYRPNQFGGDITFSRFLTDLRTESDRAFKRGTFQRISPLSNLKSDVLAYCCTCVGIDFAVFSTYVNFIDQELVDKRNHIAHGSSLRLQDEAVPYYRDKVVDLMRITLTEIENAVASESYKKEAKA